MKKKNQNKNINLMEIGKLNPYFKKSINIEI
jgi:hypothetical protein